MEEFLNKKVRLYTKRGMHFAGEVVEVKGNLIHIRHPTHGLDVISIDSVERIEVQE